MKKASIIRIIGFIILAFILMEISVDSGDQYAIVKFPIIWLILLVLILFAIAAELMLSALQNVLYRSLNPEAKSRYDSANQPEESKALQWIKRKYKEMVGVEPIEEEQTIVLDHNYDGIRELDNNLPPWWIYLFYASIIFAVVYMARYHIFDGIDQNEEYEIEVAEAKLAIEEFKKNNKDLVDANSVVQLTEAADIAAGKEIYATNCVACHKDTGAGGIGPNLTDEYWILGGGIKNIFHTISEGGRAGKGMIAWKSELKPSEMAQVASYIMTLKGTNPPEPKEAEGDIWVDENAAATETGASAKDSTGTKTPEVAAQ